MDFRARLREEIAFSGLSTKEVAAKAGVTKRAVDSYVSSQACMPAADVAVRLAQALNTSVEYLVSGIASQPAAERAKEDARRLMRAYSLMNDKQKLLLLAVADDIQRCL